MGKRKGEQRQRILARYLHQQRIGQLRVDPQRSWLDQPRRLLDHRAVGALQHHVEGEGVLGQRSEARVRLHQRKGIRAHGEYRQRARIGPQRAGQDLDKAVRFVPAFLVEQFLALIKSENDRRRRRIFAGQSRHLPDVAQGVEKCDEPVLGLLDEVLDLGAVARQAALANPSGKSRLADDLLQCLDEAIGSGNHCALGPDDRERQPCPVVAFEARPQSRTQKGRLARARRAQDDQHAANTGAHEPADLVEPAHDLRVTSEKDRGVLLLEIGKSGIGPATCLEKNSTIGISVSSINRLWAFFANLSIRLTTLREVSSLLL